MVYIEHEWGAFPASCFNLAPDFFFITSIREPIARHISDFYYAGPGKERSFLKLSVNETRNSWHKWISDGEMGIKENIRGRYLINFYVQVFSGRCLPPRRGKNKELKINRSNPCNYGGAWKGGCKFIEKSVDSEDFALAMKVLENFSLVMFTELFADQEFLNYISKRLGIPSIRPIAHVRNNHPNMPKPLPDDILHILNEENALDSMLYNHARSRWLREYHAWI